MWVLTLVSTHVSHMCILNSPICCSKHIISSYTCFPCVHEYLINVQNHLIKSTIEWVPTLVSTHVSHMCILNSPICCSKHIISSYTCFPCVHKYLISVQNHLIKSIKLLVLTLVSTHVSHMCIDTTLL